MLPASPLPSLWSTMLPSRSHQTGTSVIDRPPNPPPGAEFRRASSFVAPGRSSGTTEIPPAPRAPHINLASKREFAASDSRLGLHQQADRTLGDTVEAERTAFGALDESTMESTYKLAVTYARIPEQHGDCLKLLISTLKATSESLWNAGAQTLDRFGLLESMVQTKISEGVEDMDTLSFSHSLAEFYMQMYRYGDAAKVIEYVVDCRMRVLGSTNVETVASRELLTQAKSRLATFAASRAASAEKVVQAKAVALGPEDVDTIASKHKLACAYAELGQFDKAAVIFKEVVEVRGRILGLNHVHTLSSTHCLAEVYHQLARYTEARNLLEDVVERRSRLRGITHKDTVESIELLKRVRQVLTVEQ